LGIPGILCPPLVEKTPVDLVDDLDVPRQEAGKEGQRPLLQSFRQKGVVGVRHGLLGDLPRLLQSIRCSSTRSLISSATGDRGVRVVELDGKALVKGFQGLSPHEVEPQHVLERAGDEEVLLGEAKKLADLRLVVGYRTLLTVSETIFSSTAW